MLDVATSFDQYKFLGNEFLTWLWFVIEKDQNYFKQLEENFISLNIGNRLILENRLNDAVETISIKGDDAGLEEGILSLQKGAVVIELNLSFSAGNDNKWQFTLKGDTLDIINIKLPTTGAIESKKDVEGFVLEKVFLITKIIKLIDNLFTQFIRLRISNKWTQEVLPLIKQWIFR